MPVSHSGCIAVHVQLPAGCTHCLAHGASRWAGRSYSHRMVWRAGLASAPCCHLPAPAPGRRAGRWVWARSGWRLKCCWVFVNHLPQTSPTRHLHLLSRLPTTPADTLAPDGWGWGPLVQGLAGAGAPAVGGHLSIHAAGHTVHTVDAGNAAAAKPNCCSLPIHPCSGAVTPGAAWIPGQPCGRGCAGLAGPRSPASRHGTCCPLMQAATLLLGG